MFSKEHLLADHTTFKSANDDFFEGISTTDEITGIEVRLNDVHVINNRAPGIKIGNTKIIPGYAKVYFLTIVASDTENNAVDVSLKAFPKIDDHESLPVDKTIFFWKEENEDDRSPSQVHVFSSIVKSKKGLRDAGEIMREVKSDAEYKSLIDQVANVVLKASAVGQVVDTVTTLASVVGKFLGKVEDKPLISVLQSFTDINGDFDNLGKTPKSFENKWARIGLSITIRDTSRETEEE